MVIQRAQKSNDFQLPLHKLARIRLRREVDRCDKASPMRARRYAPAVYACSLRRLRDPLWLAGDGTVLRSATRGLKTGDVRITAVLPDSTMGISAMPPASSACWLASV